MATPTKAVQAEKARAARVVQCRRAAEELKRVSDGTRLFILTLLSESETHVGGLCEATGANQPNMSHTLTLMRLAGLVASRREGKRSVYAITDKGRRIIEVVASLVA